MTTVFLLFSVLCKIILLLSCFWCFAVHCPWKSELECIFLQSYLNFNQLSPQEG